MSDPLIVIPARYGSRRLPGKPLRDLGGRPLIVHVVERLRSLAPIPILVATDDSRVARAVRRCGVEVCMTPVDCPTGTDRVALAVRNRRESLVINVQGDEPLVDPQAVASLIRVMQENPTLDMGTLAGPLRTLDAYQSEHTVKVILDSKHQAIYFSRRAIPWTREQAVPGEARQHIGVYAYRRHTLATLTRCGPVPLEQLEGLEQLRALYLGIPIQVVEVPHAWTSVDTETDLAQVRNLV